MNYIQFKENNEWEGETWCFYIPTEGNEKQIDRLAELIQESNLEDTYTVGNELISEIEVDALVKHGGSGYMNNHNKCSGILDISHLSKENFDDDDPFHKGGIMDFIK